MSKIGKLNLALTNDDQGTVDLFDKMFGDLPTTWDQFVVKAMSIKKIPVTYTESTQTIELIHTPSDSRTGLLSALDEQKALNDMEAAMEAFHKESLSEYSDLEIINEYHKRMSKIPF